MCVFFGFSDSVENQEGGAMYISCGDDAVAVEAGYIPNNPLFGLPLDSPQVNFRFHLIIIHTLSIHCVSLNKFQSGVMNIHQI